MRKTTLLTLALSVSALFASAQSTNEKPSLKNFERGKVYSIKNKTEKVYAAAMPQTGDMACSSTLNLACLFTITPVDGSANTYTIKPYADDTKVVYSIKVAKANNTVGIKAADNAADTKWKIAEIAGASDYVSIISATATAKQTDCYWNCTGTNADWNLKGIGGYMAASANGRSHWTIAEVSDADIATAKTNFANIYSTIPAAQISDKLGYYSQALIDEVKSNITYEADAKTAYNSVPPFANLVNLPVDGKAYKMYGLFSAVDGVRAKAYLKSNENDVFIMQKQADGRYKIVSSKADEQNFIYTGNGSQAGQKVSLFNITVRSRIDFGALNLVTAEKFTANVCISKDGSALDQYSTGSDNKNLSTEWYFEEATDYAGHAVTFTESTDGKAYATLNLPFATTIPAGVTAYKMVENTGSSVKLEVYKNEKEVLPANTPVLLQANEAGKKTFAPATYKAQETTGFSGTLAATAVTAANTYILAKDGDAVKFCKLSTTNNTVNANKAYFTLTAPAANALNFDFGGVATGIENAVADKANNAPIYDLSGRRVMNAVKGGIYIQNGKKFVK